MSTLVLKEAFLRQKGEPLPRRHRGGRGSLKTRTEAVAGIGHDTPRARLRSALMPGVPRGNPTSPTRRCPSRLGGRPDGMQ
jgi:hypothetical protein